MESEQIENDTFHPDVRGLATYLAASGFEVVSGAAEDDGSGEVPHVVVVLSGSPDEWVARTEEVAEALRRVGAEIGPGNVEMAWCPMARVPTVLVQGIRDADLRLQEPGLVEARAVLQTWANLSGDLVLGAVMRLGVVVAVEGADSGHQTIRIRVTLEDDSPGRRAITNHCYLGWDWDVMTWTDPDSARFAGQIAMAELVAERDAGLTTGQLVGRFIESREQFPSPDIEMESCGIQGKYPLYAVDFTDEVQRDSKRE